MIVKEWFLLAEKPRPAKETGQTFKDHALLLDSFLPSHQRNTWQIAACLISSLCGLLFWVELCGFIQSHSSLFLVFLESYSEHHCLCCALKSRHPQCLLQQFQSLTWRALLCLQRILVYCCSTGRACCLEPPPCWTVAPAVQVDVGSSAQLSRSPAPAPRSV